MTDDYYSEKEYLEAKDFKMIGSQVPILPTYFLGINTSSFGNTVDNSFFKLKKIALDKKESLDNRTQAIRYMSFIPIINQESHVIEVIKNIIDDKTIPIDTRYELFTKVIKFTNNITIKIHEYYFDKEKDNTYPLLYTILSAQYILENRQTYNASKIITFLINIGTDIKQPVNIRAECADILYRDGYNSTIKNIGYQIIQKLGDSYILNKKSTIYSNMQNVHDTSINQSIMDILLHIMTKDNAEKEKTKVLIMNLENSLNDNKLNNDKDNNDKLNDNDSKDNDNKLNDNKLHYPIMESYKINNTVTLNNELSIDSLNRQILNANDEQKAILLNKKEILEKLLKLKNTTEINTGDIYNKLLEQKVDDKVLKSFNRLLIDTAKYLGYTISEIVVVVWKNIQGTELKEELLKRFIEELKEMDETCTTGHLSRIINVLSGFEIIKEHVKISFNEQIKNNVFARLNFALKSLSNENQEEILNQMISTEKDILLEFVKDYSVYDELYEEFVTEGHVSKELFKDIYKKSVDLYCGL